VLPQNYWIYDPLKSTFDVVLVPGYWHYVEVDDFALVLEVYAASTPAKHSTKFHGFKAQEENEYRYWTRMRAVNQ